MAALIESTIQPAQVGVARLARHAVQYGATARVIAERDGEIRSQTLSALAGRALKLGEAFKRLGFAPGSAIATFCPSSPEHVEAYLGIPAHGMILHALNVRMHDDHLADLVREIGDTAIIVERDYADRFAELAPKLAGSSIRLVTVTGEGPIAPFAGLPVETVRYEALLDPVETVDTQRLVDPDEFSAAAICHTGGTTGRPKTVVYSHRAVWFQALNLCTANSLGLTRKDTALLAVHLFHVNGWGLPYASALASASIVLPGASLRAPDLNRLIDACGVTIAAGVPTIWTDLLALRQREGNPPFRCLKRISTGGATVPQALIEDLGRRGVEIIQAWGMTETASMSVIGHISVADSGLNAEGARPIGYISPGLEIRTVAEDGKPLPFGANEVGEVQIRGVCVTRRYFGDDSHNSFDGDWLKTGDIGKIDAKGQLILTDRLKDAIKSGGEWIATPALEDALRALPDVADAAVIGHPDPRWQERPLAVVVLSEGGRLDLPAVREALAARAPKWWFPDNWAIVETLPRTNLGKPDKNRIRQLVAANQIVVFKATT
jgi:fatty-acyl-CoA synthase